MGYTVVGYAETFDSAVLQNLTALADPHVRIQGDDVIVPDTYNHLLAVFAIGASLTQVQVRSPSLRRLFNLDVQPFTRGTALAAAGAAYLDIADNPIALDADEALNVAAAEDAAGASAVYAFLLLGDGTPRPASGPIQTVRASSSTAVTAGVWSNIPITFDQSLPAGHYALVGSQHRSATALFHRFVFVGGTWRPGAPSVQTQGGFARNRFRFGGMGVLGEFSHNTPPTVDVFCTAADASHEFYLDLIKVG